MKARILTAAAAALLAGAFPAGAVNAQLLNLVAPDAKVLAGVNVDQAKTSAFGQYVLSQIETPALQGLAAQTGFDPTQDVHEVLAASGGMVSCASLTPCPRPGLLLASGTFDAAAIAAAAAAKGATTEAYGAVTIIEGPNRAHGVAFLGNNTIAVAGDVASVKAALDRQNATVPALPAALVAEAGQWSSSQDAWVISTVPPSSLHPPAGAPAIPGVGQGGAGNTFQSIQSAAAGVKFSDNQAAVTVQAQADNAQDATALANAIQLLASMAQMQHQNDAPLAALTKSLKATTAESTLNISFSLPESDLQALAQRHSATTRRR